MTSVAVVIPYYQNRKGILRRALLSVLKQQIPQGVDVHILVVDDGSPVPAQSEIEGLVFAPPFRLTVKTQPNAGPGAARNAALSHVDSATTYVAFLDSDDLWSPAHLATALSALEQGFDFYFCDCRRADSPASRFTEGSFRQFLAAHASSRGNAFYDLDKMPFYAAMLRSRVFMLSTVVFRRSVAPDLLFDPALRPTGEDCLFLFQLIAKCRCLCCSTQELAAGGDGVNIYMGCHSWDTPGHLAKFMGTILAVDQFRKNLPLTPEDLTFFALRQRKLRRLFAFLTVRYFLKKRTLWTSELVALTRKDSSFWFWYPFNVLYVSFRYLLRLYNPCEAW